MKGILYNEIKLTALCIALGIFGLLVLQSCKSEKAEISNAFSGFLQMQDSIHSIYERIDIMAAIYENEERAKAIENLIINENRQDLLFNLAIEKLNAGQTQAAIDRINEIFKLNEDLRNLTTQSKMLHEFMGIAYLRLAEQQNCLIYHSHEACIIPLKGKGIHRDKIHAEKALDIYLEILEQFPDDYQSIWLVNIAYMALGKYPHDVPENYLLELPGFEKGTHWLNVADDIGLGVNELSGGVIADDFTNNGLIDLIVSSWGFNGNIRYFENQGSNGFVEKTKESGLHLARGGLNIRQADYNNDGNLDFIILRGAWRPEKSWGILPNSLIRNNGDGTFSDVTFEAGIYSIGPSQSAEWIDFDLDGHIDLVIANETASTTGSVFPIEFYRNNGDGTFTEKAEELGLFYAGYFKGVVSGDIDNDGYPDLFFSNLAGPNLLMRNLGPEKGFENIAQSAGVEKPFSAFPAMFIDVNQDGYEDLYIATFETAALLSQSAQLAKELKGQPTENERNHLYINNGNLSFENQTDLYFEFTALSTMGCNFGDINNNGFPDIYLGTGAPDYRSIVPNRFFENQLGSHFADKTFEYHLGHIQKGHGIAFADFNNNGFQDIYAVIGGAFQGDVFHNALFVNPGNNSNWVKIKLEGEKSNRFGIGAQIVVEAVNPAGEKIKRYSRISSGASFGANPLIAHIGIEDAIKINKIEIRWPIKGSDWQVLKDLEINKFYTINESNELKENLHEYHPYELLPYRQLHCRSATIVN